MRYFGALGTTLLSVVAGTTMAQAPSELFLGTWTLDRSASQYADAAAPDRMTLVIEDAPEGLSYRSQTAFAGGRTSATSFVARFDGVPAVVVGTSGFLAPVSLSRTGDHQIDAVYTLGLKKVAWSQWVMNAAGSELVVATTYLDSKGSERHNVVRYRKTR